MSSSDPAYEAIRQLGTAPLWSYYGDLFMTEPKSRAVPHLWSYAALRPHLLHFADVLSLEEAERRVLMLVNPGLTEPPATTATLYAGIQVILPGESAQAQRHTAAAFRYVIEGSGAYTTVDGERVHMHPGDLLLTPGWHWHDHSHEGGRAHDVARRARLPVGQRAGGRVLRAVPAAFAEGRRARRPLLAAVHPRPADPGVGPAAHRTLADRQLSLGGDDAGVRGDRRGRGRFRLRRGGAGVHQPVERRAGHAHHRLPDRPPATRLPGHRPPPAARPRARSTTSSAARG